MELWPEQTIAGTEVEEERARITVTVNAEIINSEVDVILDEIVEDLDMSSKPSNFQSPVLPK